ncbi:Leucine-rich repeat-containing protein [Artemisia annua]|uniref:Leucine-rich repeat-containing protein n=1 Tax=Artemisia annua TaxID=35608 RepID=A0A2U1NMX7_ARTAN|nr:Leucine-rich repeat-containing protein [Artemisia annua]
MTFLYHFIYTDEIWNSPDASLSDSHTRTTQSRISDNVRRMGKFGYHIIENHGRLVMWWCGDWQCSLVVPSILFTMGLISGLTDCLVKIITDYRTEMALKLLWYRASNKGCDVGQLNSCGGFKPYRGAQKLRLNKTVDIENVMVTGSGVLNDTQNRRTWLEQDAQQRGFQVPQSCSFHSSACFWDSLRFKSMNMVIGSYYYPRKPLLIFQDYLRLIANISAMLLQNKQMCYQLSQAKGKLKKNGANNWKLAMGTMQNKLLQLIQYQGRITMRPIPCPISRKVYFPIYNRRNKDTKHFSDDNLACYLVNSSARCTQQWRRHTPEYARRRSQAVAKSEAKQNKGHEWEASPQALLEIEYIKDVGNCVASQPQARWSMYRVSEALSSVAQELGGSQHYDEFPLLFDTNDTD